MFWIEAVLGKAVAGRYRARFFSAAVGVAVAVLVLTTLDYVKAKRTPALTDLNVLYALEGMSDNVEARALASSMSDCLGQDFIAQDCIEYAVGEVMATGDHEQAAVARAMGVAVSGLRR